MKPTTALVVHAHRWAASAYSALGTNVVVHALHLVTGEERESIAIPKWYTYDVYTYDVHSVSKPASYIGIASQLRARYVNLKCTSHTH